MSSGRPAPSSLAARHDALLVDLDGVVHLGDAAIETAPPALAQLRAAGLRVTFVTNNAARPAEAVAAHLSAIGVPAAADEVLTSSMAAAAELRRQLAPGARVLVVGGAGLHDPVAAAGLQPVATADDEPVAVVQGWSPDLTWALLAEGCIAIRRGARWVATNRDLTLPSPRGPLPGNGSMVAALSLATGREPLVVGKPEPTLFRIATEAAGAQRPLVVGDRLDTDVAGATRCGLPSLLVLTGVSRPLDLIAAPPQLRPTYVGHDLGAVLGPAAAIADDSAAGDGLDELRAACRAAWSGTIAPDSYADVVRRLGLE